MTFMSSLEHLRFKDPITDKGKASKKGRLTLQLASDSSFSDADKCSEMLLATRHQTAGTSPARTPIPPLVARDSCCSPRLVASK